MRLSHTELLALLQDRKFRVGDLLVHRSAEGLYVISDVSIDADTEVPSLRYEYIQASTGLKFSRSKSAMEDGRFSFYEESQKS